MGPWVGWVGGKRAIDLARASTHRPKCSPPPIPLDEESSCLGEVDLEADVGNRVPLEQPTQIVSRPLSTTDQDDRIRAVFGLTSDDRLPDVYEDTFDQYHAYLAANLTFPFEAGYWKDAGPFESSKKCKVSVVGLANLDGYCPEEVGLVFKIRHDNKQETTVVQTRAKDRSRLFGFMSHVLGMSAPIPHEDADYMPLSDLELTDKDANQQSLKDFNYWLRNHC